MFKNMDKSSTIPSMAYAEFIGYIYYNFQVKWDIQWNH